LKWYGFFNIVNFTRSKSNTDNALRALGGKEEERGKKEEGKERKRERGRKKGRERKKERERGRKIRNGM